MNSRNRTLMFALAAAASLGLQVPAFADPPGRKRSTLRSTGSKAVRPDPRYGYAGGGAVRPNYAGYNGNGRYPVYPVHPAYPGRPYYPYYPGAPVLPLLPARGLSGVPVYPAYPYYSYYGYPGYYGYRLSWLLRRPRRRFPVRSSAAPGPGPCNATPALGAAGAMTGAIVGNAASAPYNRGAGTVIGAVPAA